MPARTVQRSRRARRRRSPWIKWLKIAACLVFLFVGVPALIVGFIFVGELNKAAEIVDRGAKDFVFWTQRPSVIVSADGKLLYRVSTEYREPLLRIEDVPKVVRDATIAAEDKRFYQHRGLDYWAMVRMLLTNAREGRLAQGGSTLTMQLAKRIFTSPERTFRRKLRDMALAVQIERRFTKDQILLLYLNQVYYGSGAYGIKAAAEVYFGKSLDDLTVSEAALLARTVRRPSSENPFDDLATSVRNRDIVLGIMRDERMIGEAEYDQAVKSKPKLRRKLFASGAVTFAAPYFVQYVLDVLRRQAPDVDLTKPGYVVQTTLDTRLQDLAEHEVERVVRQNRRRRVTTAAFVLMDANGRLKAMVGGVDFKRNQYNVVTQGHRQPGSSFKPFVYATALATGALAPTDTISNDRFIYTDPVTGRTWQPDNSGGRYGGRRTIKSAIANSVNVCAVRVIEQTGPSTVVDYAHNVFGFRSDLRPFLSLALGSSAVSPLEMAQAYSVFMLQGDRATPFGIDRIVGPDGRVEKAYEPNIVRNLLSKDVCAFLDDCLRAVVTGGTASHFSRAMPPNSRGKTGTTSDNRDAWFCGYTDDLVGIGWVGNEHYDSQEKVWVYDPMSSTTFGGTVTVQIWAGVLKRAERYVAKGFERDHSPGFAGIDEGAAPTEPQPIAVDGGAKDGQPKTDPAMAPDLTNPPGAEVGPKPLGPNGNGPGIVPVDEPKPPAHEPRPPVGPAPGPKPSPPPVQYVEVEVCADTGLRATTYCPETVIRRFPKGKVPRRTCTLHRPKY